MDNGTEKLIAKHMNLLKITREEAIQLIEDDKRIDKGEKLFSLTPEQEKASKKARSAGRKPKTTVYKFDTTKRKKPENKNKSDLISVITGALTEHGAENLELINPEREFTFTMDGTKYKIVLRSVVINSAHKYALNP